MSNTRFKKGELSREAFSVLMHDLESLDLRADLKSNNYHYELLKANLEDLFGIKKWKKMNKEEFDKLDYDTKIEWFINVFTDDIESDFIESPEYDEAVEKHIKRLFDEISEDKLKILLEEIGD